jgi:hypothetical protein
MLAVIVAIRVGMRLEIWQAVLLATTGWALYQTVRRTAGRPIMRLQRWLSSRAAGVPLNMGKGDVARVRRRPTRTWYLQLESWRRRRKQPPPPEVLAEALAESFAETFADALGDQALAPVEGQPHAGKSG